MSLKKISQLNKIPQARDSHAEAVNSRLSRNFREKVTMVGANCPAVSYKVYYPRIKKCADGTYIMFNQDSRVSACVYYAKSYDGLYYSNRQPLFNASLTVRDDGEEDKLCYASCDAIVLKSGKILAFASYRYNKGYVLDAKYSGLARHTFVHPYGSCPIWQLFGALCCEGQCQSQGACHYPRERLGCRLCKWR